MTTRYNAEDITVLEGLDAVRKRPGMYVGGVGKDGLHHLLWEIVDNAVDEAIGGYATTITVILHQDGCSATVTDNGRGIPVDLHPKLGKSALEVVFCTLHSGGKFGGGAYKTSGGLHGVGASVVNALSSDLTVIVRRDDTTYVQEYRRGVPEGPVESRGPARGTGTTVSFRPDPAIFPETRFDAEFVSRRLDEKAYLNPGLRIAFRDEATARSSTFQHEGGVADLVRATVKQQGDLALLPDPFVLRREEGGTRFDLALTWTDAPRETVLSFVNTVPTRDGGTHEQGAKDAIVKAVRGFMETHDAIPKGVTVGAEDIREGLVACVSAFVEEPQFQGQTKDRLNNPEIRPQVDALVRPALEVWLHQNASQGDAVAARVIQAARARAASRAAASQVRKKASPSHRLNLPGKLADCSSSDPARSELFIVEGDSAGGSAKQGRDRRHQAVLPLRGKVLNSEQATLDKVVGNRELSDIVNALGCGMGEDFELSRLRYHRIVLLMDADSDGHHITTLLLTFFFRHLPQLIDVGHVFLAQPPLYRIQAGKDTHWARTDAHRERILAGLPKNVKPEITRFKGLGEMMPETLFRTTMDPERRSLLRVRVPDGERLRTDQVMTELMGKDVARRFEMIMAGLEDVAEVDV